MHSWNVCQMVCIMCRPTPVHSEIQCAVRILRCPYIRNPLEILICCFMFFLQLLLRYILIKPAQSNRKWASLLSLHHCSQSLCSTLQLKMRMRGNVQVSSCFSLLGSNVCNSSFLTFSRCHGWIWAQNRSAFPNICSGCQRSHCQTGVLCSGEVSKQGHIAQIWEVFYYAGILLITWNNKLQAITALFLRDPLGNTPFVFHSSLNYIIPLPEWEPGVSCLQARC